MFERVRSHRHSEIIVIIVGSQRRLFGTLQVCYVRFAVKAVVKIIIIFILNYSVLIIYESKRQIRLL